MDWQGMTQQAILALLRSSYQLPDEQVENLCADSRVKVAEAAVRWLVAKRRELQRLEQLSVYEQQLNERGITLVAGVDEAGRGPLAGPVVAGAVILPVGCRLFGINDSKKLSEKRRFELEPLIKAEAIAWGIGYVDAAQIDEINILQATLVAMRNAVSYLAPQPQHVLADALTIPGVYLPQTALVHGDALSISIGAASILAKCERDRLMIAYDRQYPAYNFAKHKGYGTAEHVAALAEYGQCPIHRRSFVLKESSRGGK